MEQQFSNLDRVMEPGTICKNGASPKSQMSRGKILIIPFLVFTLFLTSCEKFDLSQSTTIVWPVKEINANGETIEVIPVTSSVKINLTVTSCPEWITTEIKGDVIYLTASKNESTLTRLGSIYYTYSGSEKKFFRTSSVSGVGSITVRQDSVEPD